MIRDLQLIAVVKHPKRTVLLRIPLDQALRDHLEENWNSKYDTLIQEYEQIEFKAGYRLGKHQCFTFSEFDLPTWMEGINSQAASSIGEIGYELKTHNLIQGTAAFAKNSSGEEVVLFQDFARSKVVDPGRYLQFDGNLYRITSHRGFLLDRHLSAVFLPVERKLIFRSFRAVNSFLPIFDFYKKVSENEVLELLEHSLLTTEDPGIWLKSANQWFRTRLSQLRISGILNRFSADEIKKRSNGFDIQVNIKNDKIVLPSDTDSAKKLLQFLNEELFKGVFTNTIYETRSKRPRQKH